MMTSIVETSDRVVRLARGMRELVRAEAGESERMRTLTPAIVDEMWASGLMSAFNPVAAGGVEPSFTEMIETWIEMAWQDGSFGWIGIANFRRRSPPLPIWRTTVSPKCSRSMRTASPWAVSSSPTGRGSQRRAATG